MRNIKYGNVPQGENYALWDTPMIKANEFEQFATYEKLVYLCKLAHLAPSSHNTQPWRFKIDADNAVIKVYLDRSLILSESDIAGRQAVISVGCAIANMEVALDYFGVSSNIETFEVEKNKVLPAKKEIENKQKCICLGTVALYESKKGPVAESADSQKLFKAIFSRRVVRAEYNPSKGIPKNIINALQESIDNKHIKLTVITDTVRKFTIAEFQAQADGFVLNSLRFNRELGEWLLPNDSVSSLGMPGVGFGLADDQALRLHNGLLGKIALEPEDSLKFSLLGKRYIESSPIVGIITVPKDEVKYWVEAGRSFEKIFLILESKGINVSVHAAITEVSLINRMFASSIMRPTRKLVVLFRAGWVKEKNDALKPHSPRLSIEEVILK